MKNKVLIILVVILSICAIGLTGFIVYDKVVMGSKENECTINEKEESNVKVDTIKDIDFPKENDSNVIAFYLSDLIYQDGKSLVDLNTDFQDVSFTYNDTIKYSLSCGDFSDRNSCNYVNVSFVDLGVNLGIQDSMGCSLNSYVLLNDTHLIEQKVNGCGGAHAITVYDKHGNVVMKEINSVRESSPINDYESSLNVQVVLKDNELNYVTYDETTNNLIYHVVNLNNYQKVSMKQFEGWRSGQA